jgi:hypothetical protein
MDWEECFFNIGDDFAIGITNAGTRCNYLNCKAVWGTTNKFVPNGVQRFIGLKTSFASAASGLFRAPTLVTNDFEFSGCDFSDQAHTLFSLSTDITSYTKFLNCQLHASSALVTGTAGSLHRVEFYGTVNVTGKSSGTIQAFDIATSEGNITEETTAVRTGGADDGNGGWSMAFTPLANATRDQYRGLIGPWMAFKITGDGTAQTVSVSIANSGAADYNDDDVWLEVMYPSEGGTAQYDNQTTQMDLLGTPTAITDDTGSAWGGGVGNHQTLYGDNRRYRVCLGWWSW